MHRKTPNIPNIDIGQAYDTRFEGADIHIDSLHNLSDFFGRDMPAHRHDRFYQIHWLETGKVDVQLGDQHYQGRGPLFYFTPPAVPHSFKLDAEVVGLVLTVRRELVNRLLFGSDNSEMQQHFSVPVFVELNAVAGKLAREAENFPTLFTFLADEFFGNAPGRRHTLPALVDLVLVNIFRLSEIPERATPLGQEELKIFTAFNALVDKNYLHHWRLEDYCTVLNVTQSRLADICRRLSGIAPKGLVFQRQIEEARWQLIYTTTAINIIAIEMGFKDPAYFCRFFTKHTGLSPREFRRQALLAGGNINL